MEPGGLFSPTRAPVGAVFLAVGALVLATLRAFVHSCAGQTAAGDITSATRDMIRLSQTAAPRPHLSKNAPVSCHSADDMK